MNQPDETRVAPRKPTIDQSENTHAQKADEIVDLIAEREALQSELKTQAETAERLARNLDRIHHSRGWKVLSMSYRLRDRLLPDNRVVRTFANLVRHLQAQTERFLPPGGARLIAASGLFDSAWYLQQYPQVAASGMKPLEHYLRLGAREGHDPNPLFDSDWYLRQNPEAAASGINPLEHYLRQGALEGRDPSPLFDTDRYLQQHPAVVKAGENPLAHYLRSLVADGAAAVKVGSPSGKSAARRSPRRSGESPSIVLRSIPCPSSQTQSRPDVANRRLICLSHVLPYPSRAGNEYRIHRMLRWLSGKGFDVFLVVCPLPGDSVSERRLTEACSLYPNIIICQRDGTLLHRLAEGEASVEKLAGVRPRDIGALLKEEKKLAISANVLSMTRMFCPDLLIEVLQHLDAVLKPQILWVNYVWMTRVFPVIRPEVLKVVDTHDVFSTKREKVNQFGIEDNCAITPAEEKELLKRADLVVAIQSGEEQDLRRLAPGKRTVTAGVDFDLIDSAGLAARSPIILMVASDNALNEKGLRDFLRFAWPIIHRDVPAAELRIVGGVGAQMDLDDPSVKKMGRIDDLAPAYAEARVVINPAVAGTGLKIKTVESIFHLRPIVCWPSGVEGIESDMQDLCRVATDWYGFARHVIDLCETEESDRTLIRRANQIRERFSADTVYRALGETLHDLLDKPARSPRADVVAASLGGR